MTPSTPLILRNHIYHKSGRAKTVCVTACLTALGVPFDSYHYTGGAKDSRRESILRKNGYCVRSRMSALGKQKTVGNARKVIRKLADPADTYYLLVVKTGKRDSHALLLDRQGLTVVDTAPVKVDRRRIISIKACFKPNH